MSLPWLNYRAFYARLRKRIIITDADGVAITDADGHAITGDF